MTQHSARQTALGTTGGDEGSWATAAGAVLRKAGRLAADAPDSAVWDGLACKTAEGLVVPPLGTIDRAIGLETGSALADPGVAPYLRGSLAPSSTGWDVRTLVADPDPAEAHRAALTDLEGGASSLWIRVGDGGTALGDLPVVLAHVHLDMAPVVLDPVDAGSAELAARALAGLVRDRSTTLHPDSALGADPIGRLAAVRLDTAAAESTGSIGNTDPGRRPEDARQHAAGPLAGLPDVLTLARDLGVRALVVDGAVAHEAGAGDAGELGYTLAVGAAYLRAMTEAGVDVDTACGLMEFRYAATDDQFATIAKLRAARLAWHRVAELSGATASARAQRQHAVTSSAMLTRYDPWVNLMRTTVAAFAAGAGGATAVTVLPFDSALGIPDEFGRRMARNISALLVGESHVGVVADPAGGAHAVEMLTAELADAAWGEFGLIEGAGGILTALADGSLAERIAGVRRERYRRIATRQHPITGVSEFPNPAESLPQRRPLQGPAAPDRWAEPFEALRDHPPQQRVLLATIGTAAAASSRLLFTRSLLAAGGIAVADQGSEEGVAEAVTRTGCRTVVLAGADADYADALQTTATAARDAGATAVFVAGRPAGVLMTVPDGLIDGTVGAGDDVLAFLHSVRATLTRDQR